MLSAPSAASGFLTKRGFLQASLTRSLKRIKVGEVMKQPVIRVTASTPIKKTLEILQAKQVRRVAVFDPTFFKQEDPETWRAAWLGMVSDNDIFRNLGQNVRQMPPPAPTRTASTATGGGDDSSPIGITGRGTASQSAADLSTNVGHFLGAPSGDSMLHHRRHHSREDSNSSISSLANSLLVGGKSSGSINMTDRWVMNYGIDLKSS